MNKNFDAALSQALEKEFSWLDDFENPYANYEFSSQFESKMRSIILKSEYSYVSVGQRRIRKTMLVALVALLAIVITGCAFGVYYLVTWNEEQNDQQGTLDVTFDVDDSLVDAADVILPKTPTGYTITEKIDDGSSYIMIYSDSHDNQIIYSRSGDIENMSISIDNEAADFKETTIHSFKGYQSFKDGIYALYWADGNYFYELQGTCELDVLYEMIEE